MPKTGTAIPTTVQPRRIRCRSTVYTYLHEGIDVLAPRAPSLEQVLALAKKAELTHLNPDGTVVRTDRVRAPGPGGADLWWSDKCRHHGGNVQVLSAPDGWPLWSSGVRPDVVRMDG